jgi:predicted phosphodiesterase
MKVAICSDLHLEFGTITLENTEGAEVLILSGDILVERDLDVYDRRQYEMGFMSHRSRTWHDFFEDVCSKFPHVIYVAGNHEHYHGDFKYTLSGLKDKLKRHSNLHILDREVFKHNGVTFVGSTLWTDMNKEDPLTIYHMKDYMNDFRIIKNSNRYVYSNVPVYEYDSEGKVAKNEAGQQIQIGMKKKEAPSRFTPEDAVEENRKCFELIKHIVSENDNVVVVGHHTPSHQSCHPRYKDDQIMNGGYHNNYDEYIMDHPQIKLWTHGHTHEKYDYMIGETRIVCNPRGYVGHERLADEFELKVVEI